MQYHVRSQDSRQFWWIRRKERISTSREKREVAITEKKEERGEMGSTLRKGRRKEKEKGERKRREGGNVGLAKVIAIFWR